MCSPNDYPAATELGLDEGATQTSKPIRTMRLTDDEIGLLLDALDSHEYWQLSDSDERNNGASLVDDGDDPAIDDARDLAHRLTEARAGRETSPNWARPERDEDDDE